MITPNSFPCRAQRIMVLKLWSKSFLSVVFESQIYWTARSRSVAKWQPTGVQRGAFVTILSICAAVILCAALVVQYDLTVLKTTFAAVLRRSVFFDNSSPVPTN